MDTDQDEHEDEEENEKEPDHESNKELVSKIDPESIQLLLGTEDKGRTFRMAVISNGRKLVDTGSSFHTIAQREKALHALRDAVEEKVVDIMDEMPDCDSLCFDTGMPSLKRKRMGTRRDPITCPLPRRE